MKGRPKKNRLTYSWVESRERFAVVVPASWEGKRITKFFETPEAAKKWIAKMELQRASGQEIAPHDRPEDTEKSINRLAATFLDEHKGRPGHDTAKNHLDKLKAEFGGITLDELNPYRLRKWLQSLPLQPRTIWGVYTTGRTLARWAVRFRFASVNPFEAMGPPDKGDPQKVILTVEQMKRLLDVKKVAKAINAAPPSYMIAWIALGAFAGLRSEEILRMTWDQVDFESGEIHVPDFAIKKTRGGMRERYVKMLPAFLKLCPRGENGAKIVPVSRTTFHYHATRLAGILGESSWPHNCLRHSFASYHLAMWEDAGKTAHQMGHTSTAMVHQNYARAVKKEEAEKWWGIGV